jgi:hypothetical protein
MLFFKCAAETQKQLPRCTLFVIFCRLYYNNPRLLFASEKDSFFDKLGMPSHDGRDLPPVNIARMERIKPCPFMDIEIQEANAIYMIFQKSCRIHSAIV